MELCIFLIKLINFLYSDDVSHQLTVLRNVMFILGNTTKPKKISKINLANERF